MCRPCSANVPDEDCSYPRPSAMLLWRHGPRTDCTISRPLRRSTACAGAFRRHGPEVSQRWFGNNSRCGARSQQPLYRRSRQLVKSPALFGQYNSQQRTTYASNSPPQDVAVLGGGITGLATTYYLAKEFPNAKITLIESKKELGGWIKSKKVDVGNGEVLFESGPRSLRPQAPNGTLTLRMV